MFLERLREKFGGEGNNQMLQVNEKNYNKGNLTWQA